ncbi:Protein trichome birefringence [Striga hermonthica]|uniref:Protein trichome birefringence n=1 Tax=Striga hermonthica TaxID=68872 RepID=A0A9N7NFP2_STRHE|nr:Protein trichome birefringence [Striga hermonthica]
MADIAKYAPINGGFLFSDFKTHFSILRAKRTVTVAYAFVFVFIAFTIFLAFTPSSNSSSPWFTNIFNLSTSRSSGIPISTPSDESYRSHFSSIYNYFFPNSSSSAPTPSAAGSQNTTFSRPSSDNKPNVVKNQTKAEALTHKEKPNNTSISDMKPSLNQAVKNSTNPSTELNQSQNMRQGEKSRDKAEVLKSNSSIIANGEKGIVVKNVTSSSPQRKHDNGTNSGVPKKGIDDLIESLMKCDLFDGNWVKDESYPLYKPGSCSLIDEQFDCFLNGRPDHGYYKQKWKPKGCTLPRLDGAHMLELLRGKRLVFVGDSLNRNMWESLVCILRNSVKDKKKVYEENGRQHFRGEASYSFVFEDYKCTVEFFATPFLVQEWEVTGKDGTKKETLRLDLISHSADRYKNADFIVFNTGHWWTHEKTSLGKDYYQEGSHVYRELNVLEAFRKATTTWALWVDANVNPHTSLVFFRGYSASHFSGGQWNSGGACDHESEPIKNETYLASYPPKMTVLEKVIKNMKTHVTYLNVTRMTDYRKDGHPSIYRKQHLTDVERRSPLSFQDCSHWCLPGVPDAWNEILYAEMLVRLNKKQQEKKS